MGTFVKSVMTGFAFSLGAALFRKVAPSLGLDDRSAARKDAEQAGGSDSSGAARKSDGDAPLPS